MATENNILYITPSKLPGLNGLRAIAASLVLVHHVYQISGTYGDNNSNNFYKHHYLLGTDMVNLFFVISGFIITYILYKEKKEHGTVSLRNFYFRRILRIWPLYFVLIFIALFLQLTTNVYSIFHPITARSILLLVTLLVTAESFFNYPGFSVLPHYWSLSVEEQFYLFWPPLFKIFKGRAILGFSFFVVFGLIVVRNCIAYLVTSKQDIGFLKNLLVTLNHSLFGSIAIGVIGAYIIVTQSARTLKIIFSPYVQVACWLILLCSVVFSFYINYVHFEVMAVVYMVLVVNVAINPKTVLTLENKVLDRLGTISYGIYMFHWLLIPLIILGVKKIGLWEFFINSYQLPLLLLSFLFTYLLASFSYNKMELYFLKLNPGKHYANSNNN